MHTACMLLLFYVGFACDEVSFYWVVFFFFSHAQIFCCFQLFDPHPLFHFRRFFNCWTKFQYLFSGERGVKMGVMI